MKKNFLGLLSFTMVFSAVLCFGVLASETVSVETPPVQENTSLLYEIKVRQPNALYVNGSVTIKGENTVTIKNPNDKADYPAVTLKINDSTFIVDAATGARKTFEDIKDNEYIYAYVSYAMTRSMIPQTNAFVIICNMPMGMAAPNFLEVEEVVFTENGATFVTDRNVNLHLNEETEVFAFENQEKISLSDIKPGERILAWYSFVMESFPAQANPSKVMVFPYSYRANIEVSKDYIKIDGELLSLKEEEKSYTKDDELMIPLRKTAEYLGYKVQWNEKDATINVSDSEGYSVLFSIDNEENRAELNNSVAFVSLKDFSVIFILKIVQ